MALGFTILAIAIASFALGISFADIRAEVRNRIEMRGAARNTQRRHLSTVPSFLPANSNDSECRPAA